MNLIKNLRNIVIVLLLFFSCNQDKNKGVIIKGKLKNSSDYLEIKLWRLSLNGLVQVSQSTINTDGSFKINNPTIKDAGFYAIGISDQHNSILYIEPGSTITFEGDVMNLTENFDIKGNEDSEKYKKYLLRSKKFGNDMMSLLSKTKQKLVNTKDSLKVIEEYEKEVLKKRLEMEEVSKNYVEDNKESIIAIAALENIDFATNQNLFSTTSKNLKKIYPDNYFANEYLDYIINSKKGTYNSGLLTPGNKAPNFRAKTVKGKDFELNSLKGKYVVLDFWASWCGPCRKFNPKMVKIYNKFKNKNVEFVGISLDNKRDAWERAIIKDKLPWIHVSDLGGWESELASLYQVSNIPSAYVISPDGTIISSKIHGLEIEGVLDEAID